MTCAPARIAAASLVGAVCMNLETALAYQAAA